MWAWIISEFTTVKIACKVIAIDKGLLVSAEKMWYAACLNSFASGARDYSHPINGKPPVMQILERAAMVEGLTDLDLNYPDHAEYRMGQKYGWY